MHLNDYSFDNLIVFNFFIILLCYSQILIRFYASSILKYIYDIHFIFQLYIYVKYIRIRA